jgi:hypothetical protein
MAKAKGGGAGDITVSITEVVFSEGPKRHIRVQIDGEEVRIPVSDEVYAYWQAQFVRPNPTHQQRKKFATMMNIVRAAYKEGHRQGSGE